MSEILDEAKKLIDGERAQQYGPFEENAERLAGLWGEYLHDHKADQPRVILAADVPIMLALLKVMRLAEDPGHHDSLVDGAGYLALAGRLQGEDASDRPEGVPDHAFRVRTTKIHSMRVGIEEGWAWTATTNANLLVFYVDGLGRTSVLLDRADEGLYWERI